MAAHRARSQRSQNPTPDQPAARSNRELAIWIDGLDSGTLRILLKAASNRDELIAESIRETVEFPGELDRLVHLDFSHHSDAVKVELDRKYSSFDEELAMAIPVINLISSSLGIIKGQFRLSSTYETKFSAIDAVLTIATDVHWSKTTVASRVWTKCQHQIGESLGEMLLLFGGAGKKRLRNEDAGEWFHKLQILVLSNQRSARFRSLNPVLEMLDWYADSENADAADRGNENDFDQSDIQEEEEEEEEEDAYHEMRFEEETRLVVTSGLQE